MESAAGWTLESRAAFEAVAASSAVLGRLYAGTTDGADVDESVRGGVLLDGVDRLAGPGEWDPLRLQADACLSGLRAVARHEAKTAALKARLAADFVSVAEAMASPADSPQERTAQEMSLIAEVACVLTVSERTAGALIAESLALTSALPLTYAALQDGSLSWQHARVMVDETANLDQDGAAALEAHFLDPEAPNPARGCPVGEMVPSRFRHKARTWRERHHPVSIEKRHAKSVADRRLQYVPDRDGMAWISAHLPAHQASGIWDRATAAARSLQGPDEGRTLTQLRVDLVATWLLGGNVAGRAIGDSAGSAEGTEGYAGNEATEGTGVVSDRGTGLAADVPWPRAQVLVTVPLMALLGITEEPAVLDGYGPIPPSMARQLIANGADSFHRVLIDPRDGAPLEIGRKAYRVTKSQRRWLRMRDGKCPFPGCNNQSLDNEADHLLAWANGGTTGIANLGQPCPKHHKLRHTTGWTPEPATKDQPPGWISPTGRRYASEHPDWEPPTWPEFLPKQVRLQLEDQGPARQVVANGDGDGDGSG
jgi:hypothetical protein